MSQLATLILAAGKGERMKSPKAKVLQPLGGKPLVAYPIELASRLGISKKVCVVGYQASQVKTAIKTQFPKLKGMVYANQASQKGTGHAVLTAQKCFQNFNGDVLILYGDVPLLKEETIRELIREYNKKKASLALLTTTVQNPQGYGRIIRNGNGDVLRITEEKDATQDEKQVKEINTGVLITKANLLFKTLAKIKKSQKTGEYYLTDIVKQYLANDYPVTSSMAFDSNEALGINSPLELMHAEQTIRARIVEHWIQEGVIFRDMDRTYIGHDVKIGKGSVIEPNCHLNGKTKVGTDCHIETGSVLSNAVLDSEVHVKPYCVVTDSTLGKKSTIGPFSHLRPGTKIAEETKLGNFVETKKMTLGKRSKVNHLSYIGDAWVGADVNIGAGTITCNYDGKQKHKTILKDKVFVGSDTQFVAPITVGQGAFIGAGTTVTKNVPPKALAIARAPQSNVKNWKKRG